MTQTFSLAVKSLSRVKEIHAQRESPQCTHFEQGDFNQNGFFSKQEPTAPPMHQQPPAPQQPPPVHQYPRQPTYNYNPPPPYMSPQMPQYGPGPPGSPYPGGQPAGYYGGQYGGYPGGYTPPPQPPPGMYYAYPPPQPVYIQQEPRGRRSSFGDMGLLALLAACLCCCCQPDLGFDSDCD